MSGGTVMEHLANAPHKNEENAIRYLTNFVKVPVKPNDEDDIKKKEESIMELGNILAKSKRTQDLRQMIENTRPFLVSLGKAKAAKLVRNLLDLCLTIEDEDGDIKVELCKECIEWARDQNRVFLRQTLEARLVRLYNDLLRYQEALSMATPLVRELKKLDDKDLIVEVQLEESKSCYNLSNLTKARAALTSARTTANSIYIPPRMQAALDMQSGILHAADERDFKTAFSYFYESFEGYDSVDEKTEALRALKYMLLSKVMLDLPDEVHSLLSGKLALKYSGSDLDAMRAIADAAKKRSLADFNKAFGSFRKELQCDPVVKKHFNSLSDSMLEKDLCRIIEPYSEVQIEHIAQKIGFDQSKVEKKLSQMILDKKFSGSLHQGEGVLIVYDDVPKDKTFATAVDTIHAMGEVNEGTYDGNSNALPYSDRAPPPMSISIDSLSIALAHIEQLIASVGKKGSKQSSVTDTFEKLNQISSNWGREAEVYLLRILFSSIDFTAEARTKANEFVSPQAQLLHQLIVQCAVSKHKRGFVSHLGEAFDRPLRPTRCPGGIAQISRVIRLSPVQHVVFAIALLRSSKPETRASAVAFLRETLPGLLKSYSDSGTSKDTGLQDCAVEAVHLILTSLDEDPDRFSVSAELKESFLSTLKRDFPADSIPVILLPWLSANRRSSLPSLSSVVVDFPTDSSSRADIMDSVPGSAASLLPTQIQEIGYAMTSNMESCRQHLNALKANDHSTLNPVTVARILTVMVQTHSNLKNGAPLASVSTGWIDKGKGDQPTSWDVQVFAKTVNEMSPNLNWSEVVMQLDQPGFCVRDRAGLQLLTTGLLAGLEGNAFPIALLYREWNFHKNGQLSWVMQILQNPDLFCFADYPHRQVQLDLLKVQPEDTNKETANWKSLDLIDVLLKLSDAPGQSGEVQQAFRFPITNCPDVLMLGLLQVQPPMNALRQELLQMMMPVFLGNHPNAMVVLNYAWNSTLHNQHALRNTILNAMASFYMKSPDDQAKLTRVLEVAHELKPNGLAALFNLPQYLFTIDLACLASRRDFLKLDKWINDKIQEHQEPFVQQLIQFLKRRWPTASFGTPGTQGLPTDIIQTLLGCLHTVMAGAPASIANDISVLLGQFRQLQMANKPDHQSGPKTPVHMNQPSLLPPAPNPIVQPQPLPLSSAFGQSRAVDQAFGGSGPNRAIVSLFPNRVDSMPVGYPTSSSGFSMPADQMKSGVGASGAFGSTPTPFGNPHSMTASPTRMLHSAFGRSPAGQVQQSTSSWGTLLPANGAIGMRTTPGALTPSSNFDFRLNLPPSAAAAAGQGMSDISGPGGALGPSDDPMAAHFSEEIQAEANSYFQQIYAQTGQMPVAEFVAKLKQFRTSPNPKDRDVLACVVKNLFEEYRFFHDYPDRELRTTAEVYGGIIREGIITSIQFATAVRKVIESLLAEPNSRLWTFGIVALTACRTKLSGYPKVCGMIMTNPNFASFPQPLKDYVTAGCKGQLPPHAQGRETPSWQPQVRPSSEVTGAAAAANGGRPNAPAVLSMTSVDTLVNATEKEGIQLVEPPEVVVEKVSFLFNNLSMSNLPKKTEEMRVLIEENGKEFLRWLAQYMVMKRVSIEQNFQPLYNNFLTAINDKQLEKACKEETFRNIRILLRSDKRQAASNFGDRQLLKNLGMWLGMITIAKDTPILNTELDLKSLLMEAYYKGQQELLFVVPFIAKIISSCSKSEIFTPDCAWIRAMIKILAELHCEPDLKLNLKFEIEVLCKELQVDLRNVELEGVLKDTDRLLRVPQQLGDLKLLKQPDTATQIGPSPVPTAPLQQRQADAAAAESGAQQSAADDSAGGQSTVAVPAHFYYHDINVTSFQGLAPHLKISATIPLFQMNPQLKHVVRPAVDHAVKELIGPVTERAIKVAMTATEHVCRKDFSLDPDENKLRRACHHMMRAMTAGMAAITCRDPLTTTLQGYLKQAFLTSLRGSSNNPEQLKLIEEAAALVTEDNIELATNFIVKTACEKATPEVDKRMEAEYQLRQVARRENRAYADPTALARAQAMPEQIRLKSGAIGQQQMAVYDEFSSKICGFKPTTAEDMIVDFPQSKAPMAAATAPTPISAMMAGMPAGDKELEAASQQLQMLIRDIDAVLNPTIVAQSKPAAAVASIRDAISQLVPNPRDLVSAVNLVQRLVEQLLHAFKNPNMMLPSHHDLEWHARLREAFIATCRILMAQFNFAWLQKCVTKVLIDCRLEYRFNIDAIDVLIRSTLIQMPTYDLHLSALMDNGSNFEATVFAQRLIKLYLAAGDRNQINIQEGLPNTIDIINRLAQFQGRTQAADPFSAGSDSLPQRQSAAHNIDVSSLLGAQQQGVQPIGSDRLASFHAQSAALVGGHPLSGITGRTGDEDPPDLQGKVEMILREWIQLCYTPIAQREPQTALAQIVHVMHEHGVLSTDEMISRFFRLCTEMCVDVSYRLLKTDAPNNSTLVRQRCYYTLDAFVRLTCLMVKHSDGGQYQTKINLLKKVLNIVTNVLHQDHEVRRHEFHAMPYHRILIMMFNELTVKDSVLDPIAWSILETFGQVLFILQPRRVPGFAYSWLDIVGHRNFIGRMLSDSPEPLKTAAMYTQLIICHLKFLAPFLRNIELPKSIAMMYKGTLRVLLVILHDFPELLCEYHYVICDAIPPNCVQLRNLILSAYPRNMRLPDPFMQNLKVDNLVEITHQPKIHVNLSSIIPPQLRSELDSYLENRAPVSFLSELPRTLQVTQTSGSKYNVMIMNAVVLYVGMRAIEAIQEKQQRVNMSTIAHTAYMDIFQNLAVSLCTEGRYLLFNAIANQLRYPNSHTHYFSYTLLYLFLEANTQVIQEQITRILFERLVALRPHPWGLLITFIELIKNTQYGFWQHEFTRCAPEIERLFQSVANSCMGNRAQSMPVGQDK